MENYEKKYKEALEKARQLCAYPTTKSFISDLQDLFPELTESEDEKVRQKILFVFYAWRNNKQVNIPSKKEVEKAITWLERQAEQKPNPVLDIEIPFGAKDSELQEATYYIPKGFHAEIDDDKVVIKQGKQKPAWSEEDEKIRKEIVLTLEYLVSTPKSALHPGAHYTVEEALAWLKKQGSLKDVIDRAKDSWYNEGKIAGMAEGLTNDEKYQQGWHDALEKLGEQEKDILEDAILDGNEDGLIAETIRYKNEKQSKQKLDKVEPKFKVGDWIINPRTGLIKHIKNVLLCDNNGNYEFESSSMSIDSVDNSFHLWTIKDAKDGDVLVGSYGTFILMGKSNSGYCGVLSDNTFIRSTGNNEWTENLHPATKEQRDLLFQKMYEAGYEWDAGKKELKKINSYCQENCKGFQETGKCFVDGNCKAKKEAEQKSVTWNEEDETNLTNTIIMLKEGASHHFLNSSIVPCVNWLISLKDRVGCEANCTTTKEWSEEDEQHIDSLLKRLDSLCRNKFERTRFAISEDRDWLKSLRPQKCLIPSEEEIEKAAQEWDSKANFNPFYMTMENDKPTGVKQSITTHKESFIAGVNWILKSIRPQNKCAYNPYKAVVESIAEMCKHYDKASHSGLRDFYDNVKVKCKDAQEYDKMFPQTQWKPSDEQMEALDWQVENTSVSSWQYKATKELMEDLKKLKES